MLLRNASRRRRGCTLATGAAVIALLNPRALGQPTANWLGGNGLWSAGGLWDTGIAPNSGTTSVFIDHGNGVNSTVTLDISATVANLTLDAGDSLALSSKTTLSLTGDATINGSASLSASGSTLRFIGSSDQTLGGAGVVAFNGLLFNQGTTRARLTLGPNLFFHGSGSLTDNSGGIVNQGTIAADAGFGSSMSFLGRSFTNASSASLMVTNRAILSLGTTTWHNAGTISVFNATANLGGAFTTADMGTVVRGGSGSVNIVGTLDNTGSTLTLNGPASGSWGLASNGTIRGGMITSTSSAPFLVGAGANDGGTLEGVTLAVSPKFAPSAYLNLLGNVTLNNVTLDLTGGVSGQYGTLILAGNSGMTLGGAGTIFMGTNANSLIQPTGATLGPGILVHGAGQFLNSASNGTVINQGTIVADVSGQNLFLDVYQFTNSASGSVVVTNGAMLTLGNPPTFPGGLWGKWHNAGAITLYSGTINLSGLFSTSDIGNIVRPSGSVGGSVWITGSLDNTVSTLALNSTTGAFILHGGTIRGGTIAISGGGSLQFDHNSTTSTLDGVTLRGGVFGPLDGDPGVSIINGLSLTNGGALNLAGSRATFTGTNAQTLGGSGDVDVGTISVNGGGNIIAPAVPGSLTFGPGILIHGQWGEIYNAGGGINVFNQGTISADVANGLLYLAKLQNNGVIRATNGGKVGLFEYCINAGVVIAGANSTVQFGGSFTNQGSIQAGPGAVLNLGSTQFVQTAGLLQSSGDVPNSGTLQITGGSAVLGSLSGTGSLLLGNVGPGPTVAMTVNAINQNGVTIQNTGLLVINPGTARLTHSIGALALSGNATLDIGNHDVVISGTYTNVAAAIKLAAGSPTGPLGLNPWTGSGITSSLVKTDAAAGHTNRAAIGFKDNADYVASGNSGKTVAVGKVLVSYAAYGDANLDNIVDIADQSIWNNNFATGNHWGQGDFNYDGVVDIADLSIWNNNFAGKVTPSPAVPAPRTFAAAPKTLSGGTAVGAPVAPATPPVNTLELDIDASTGDATINSGGVSIAAVEIDSAAKDLITGNWKSFKNFYHVSGWSFTKGVPNTAVVAEFTSDASSSGTPIALAAGSLTDYGNIVPVGFNNASDLTFKYNILLDAAGNTQSKVGNVVITGGVPEPTSLGLVFLGGAGLLSRRRGRRRKH